MFQQIRKSKEEDQALFYTVIAFLALDNSLTVEVAVEMFQNIYQDIDIEHEKLVRKFYSLKADYINEVPNVASFLTRSKWKKYNEEMDDLINSISRSTSKEKLTPALLLRKINYQSDVRITYQTLLRWIKDGKLDKYEINVRKGKESV